MPIRTQPRLAAIAFRWSIAVLFALWVLGVTARAQQPAKVSITGVYNGSYTADSGAMKFKLSVTQQDNGTLGGTFTLYVGDGADAKPYTCDVRGRYIAPNRMVQLVRVKWQTAPPAGVDMLGMNGQFDPAGGDGAGQIAGTMRARPAPKFQAIRNADESAKYVSANAAAQPAAGAPVTPVTPPGQAPRAAAAKPAAPLPPRPPGNYLRRNEIDGVYVGTYGSNPDDEVPARLYVKYIDDGSVNGTMEGLFTFDVPPTEGAKPITYTFKLTGVYATGTMGFWAAKTFGSIPPEAYGVRQIYADFDRSFVKGANGLATAIINPDQITGKVVGPDAQPSTCKVVATRDKDASTKLDSLMAAAEAGAGSVVSSAAPGSRGPPPGPRIIRPDIVGVYNGTYTRPSEGPTKFKLTITRTPDRRFAGVATIYLPMDSGTKPYTYSLTGAPDGNSAFHLFVNEWDTIPPKDFKNFKGMGFGGTFRSNLNQHRSRILSATQTGPNAQFFLPQFEAAWDATESQDIRGVIAAQKAVGNADQVAALQGHDEMLKNAKPKQLASKDLVRKSQAYWDAYRGDITREVFDGGYAEDVDSDPMFQQLFTTYVEQFSKKCSDFLPANHVIVTITTTTTQRGIVTDTKTETLKMDPRFVDKYGQYIGVKPAPGSAQEKEETAKTIAIIRGQILHRPGPTHGTSFADANALLRLAAARGIFAVADMERFFATEVKPTGPSAAMRQMGENLLRGSIGEPSLQEAGAKIDGAQAETDKNLPPGRFARFIDGANAFYRDPANARFRTRFETAFDEMLAARYRGVMTREEEYYYANDFGTRFRNQIMQPREVATDPAWGRLHPAVEECLKAIQ